MSEKSTTDDATMAVYAQSAADYAAGVARIKRDPQQEDLNALLAHLPAKGHVLDLGCGPGHWSARIAARGFKVTATDGSAQMAQLAADTHGIAVRVESFGCFADPQIYDGIWANFSLLHLPRAALPDMLHRLRAALKPQGALHIAMKLGSGEGRDSLGRFYAYYDMEELTELLRAAGFAPFRQRCGTSKGLAGSSDPYGVVTAHG